ncbi:lytic transglycosylase domain-containing protein [Streptomyces sp. ISL-12]|uniref:lytic transglycosylase domain-containing protein n=1 Tax=Streptomyces sp. ISL-12 TaxID=2819177 RepID=UPI001BE75F61|nr:lytic transglycosylase domain-containing protein [Streptomyces sp. ISL-12]MBT2412443.1 lytic transglycosylase domain-containing protein [Streptomyces sp. ISL-12]
MRRWLLVAACALVLCTAVRATGTLLPDGPPPSAGPSGTPSAASPSAPATSSSYDPAHYASQVRARARETGVSARLRMAILYNEAYKPHDPGLERAWQRYKPDAAFGIADMHRAAFEEVREGRDFAGRRWEDLADDRDLAIEAEAWYLHDLAARLPADRSAACTEDELLALGYNAGPAAMLAFARGAAPGDQARSYLEKLHGNWDRAGKAVGAD